LPGIDSSTLYLHRLGRSPVMKIPIATYRLQFNPEFNFEAAGKVLGYLAALGISDIYASPVLKARKNSPHGYDLIDPTQINPELGGEENFIRLLEDTKSKGLGWLQDIVPNHMAYDSQNIYLMDIFENGNFSKYRDYFDIEWAHPRENLNEKALAPFLTEFYGTCLDKTEIQLNFSEGRFFFRYADFAFPMRIEDYPNVLKRNLSILESKLGSGHADLIKFSQVVQAFEHINEFEDINERYKQISDLKASLYTLYQTQGAIREYLDLILKDINGLKDNPGSLDELDALLSRQNFRFSFWKVGNDELNYRRFFTINELLSVRIEREDVFEFFHSLIFRLLNEGRITGLRIDHFDGLYDPLSYLSRIKSKTGDTYLVAEKILDLFEIFPEGAPLEGTTGYDFLNFVNGIFIEKKNEKKFNRLYARFSGNNPDYAELLKAKKRLIMREYMAGDIDNLARPLVKLLSRSRYGKDFTMYALKRAIVEMLAHFPAYRTYISGEKICAGDEAYIKEAAAGSKNDNLGLLYELEIIERILLLNYGGPIPAQEKDEWVNFTRRFQQLCSSAMAKGLEDTFFYIYNRFLSLNEVGGNPFVFGLQLKDFHEFNAKRMQRFPYTMNASSTHDTKRGEDVRCRLNVLSEVPREWAARLSEFFKINKARKKILNSGPAPENNDEYFIYQVLVGAYPFFEHELPEFQQRMKAYIVKAVREAKVHTGWLKPDAPYEEACGSFIDEILGTQKSASFLSVFLPFQKKIAFYGVFNSLSQTLLKMCSPGIPDIYQGAELWNLSLVDPDNRKAVDFEKRSAYLTDIINKEQADIFSLITELFSFKEDGRIKLFLIYRILKTRNKYRDMFQKGGYIPLKAGGTFKEHVVVFLREYENSRVIIIAPRLLTGLIKEGNYPLGTQVWLDTFVFVPKGKGSKWSNMITGEVVKGEQKLSVGLVLQHFPVALLMNLSAEV